MEKLTAQQMIDEVRHEIENVEARLSELRAVERWLAIKVGEPLAAVAKKDVFDVVLANPPYANSTMKAAAVEVLKRSGGPLSTSHIAAEIAKGGYVTKNPKGFRNAVFSTLDRDPGLFKKVGKGTWELTEQAKQDS